MNLRRLAGAAAGMLLLTGVAAACSDDNSVFNADVGECIKSIDDLGTVVSELPEVECTEDHEAEYIGLFEHDGGKDDFDEDRVSEEANDACADKFEDYVGVPQEETRIQVAPITPTEDSWKDHDDRESICVAFVPDGTSGEIEQVDESFKDNGEDFLADDSSSSDSGDDDDSTTTTLSLGGLTQDEIDGLVDDCQGGDNGACDDLYNGTNIGSDEEEIGSTCAGRSDTELAGTCEDELG